MYNHGYSHGYNHCYNHGYTLAERPPTGSSRAKNDVPDDKMTPIIENMMDIACFKCSKLGSRSGLRTTLGGFWSTTPSQKRLWEAKGSPKERRQEDTGAVLGAKSFDKR